MALPNVKWFTAVCNARVETAESIAKEFHIPDVMDDWAELIDRRDLDIIWIGTPPHLHAPITISALEAGKHVFCQARMAMNLREGREMLAAAQARPQLVTMLCPPPHGHEGRASFSRNCCDDGYAGELYWHFRLTAVNGQFSDPLAPPHWRQRTELSEGTQRPQRGHLRRGLAKWIGSLAPFARADEGLRPQSARAMSCMCPMWSSDGQWPQRTSPGMLEWMERAPNLLPDETLTIYGRDGTLVYNFTKDEIFGARRGEKELRRLAIPPDLETPGRSKRILLMPS